MTERRVQPNKAVQCGGSNAYATEKNEVEIRMAIRERERWPSPNPRRCALLWVGREARESEREVVEVGAPGKVV